MLVTHIGETTEMGKGVALIQSVESKGQVHIDPFLLLADLVSHSIANACPPFVVPLSLFLSLSFFTSLLLFSHSLSFPTYPCPTSLSSVPRFFLLFLTLSLSLRLLSFFSLL